MITVILKSNTFSCLKQSSGVCIKYSGIQRIFEKPTFVYKLYEYHDIHFGSRLLNVSLYGIHGSDSCWPGTCLVTG
ncbi:hypothetical protein BESB_064240 [Besnoitia besnoiti]|uniref:Uncharacterized protein n=1 Tax=Besnoitia besnoiti TaxID=94643 RepID=A0A2A9M0X2_BESBE|nr:uncharacterized protein BESB_064240 [Besnoitia besnoiti]PFH30884.1 hypothetical protein BESB_064240 [Besnoitia besnoiti]